MDERTERYRAELERAKTEARTALTALSRCLTRRTTLRALARGAKRTQLAAANVYTAAACLLDPP